MMKPAGEMETCFRSFGTFPGARSFPVSENSKTEIPRQMLFSFARIVCSFCRVVNIVVLYTMYSLYGHALENVDIIITYGSKYDHILNRSQINFRTWPMSWFSFETASYVYGPRIPSRGWHQTEKISMFLDTDCLTRWSYHPTISMIKWWCVNTSWLTTIVAVRYRHVNRMISTDWRSVYTNMYMLCV